MSRMRRALRSASVTCLVAAVVMPIAGSQAATAATLPTGFQEQVVFSGLTDPTNIEFAPDGRIFVAEKGGKIKVFDNLADQTPDVFADLSVAVHNQWDRGLLGLALAPGFPTDPSVYVLYTYDAPPGQAAPVYNDVCADANGGACVVSARLSKLTASGNHMTGSEQMLISDWCQQYPSHSIGDLKFGADGALYVSGGDGANFNAVDYGQLGSPKNPCGDPPNDAMTPPTAEGGALRAQDVRTTADPTGLNGSILRLNPATGAAMTGNPNTSADANAKRIVAHGLRNPFRMTVRPGTNEIWAGDVGWNTWEEIDRVVTPTTGPTNFGWPCYEGDARQNGYDSADLTLCESLYSGAGQTAPYYTYNHGSLVVAGESCPSGGSSISGLAFAPTTGGSYPAAYAGALFFSDYSRNCIWAMMPGANGLPNPANILTLDAGASTPVDLAIGPGGELYYASLDGTIRRIRYYPNNQPPVAQFAATPTAGKAPLTVNFNGSTSSDADPADQGLLQYAWDFTNDGTTDATTSTASFTYSTIGTYTAKLKVTDTAGATGTKTMTITVGNDGPTAFIDTPAASLTWAVGNTISFSGHATDPQQGTLPASALTWRVILHHCITPDNCHEHAMNTFTGVASGTITAPDHEYPSYLEFRLTATDAGGLAGTSSLLVQPKTVNLRFNSSPSGLQLVVGSTSQTTPFTMTVIQGSTNSISAPTPQSLGATPYTFASWSDGGAQTHVITAPTTATTYTGAYNAGAPARDRLRDGESLIRGSVGSDRITSPDGRYTLVLQDLDGNLVLYEYGKRALWASGPRADAERAIDQSGRLELRDGQNRPVGWSTTVNASPAGPATLVVQNDGNVVMYRDSDQRVLWASNTCCHAPAPPQPAAGSDRLNTGQALVLGGKITSPNGVYTLVLQDFDGNLVLYKNGTQALWAFGMRADSWFINQPDGNLVAYKSEGGVAWASNTWGKGAGALVLQDDGNLVLYRNTDRYVIWATNTYGR
jgi:glucose/arabinose dehydrogenase